LIRRAALSPEAIARVKLQMVEEMRIGFDFYFL
jgi:hypothetical protein